MAVLNAVLFQGTIFLIIFISHIIAHPDLFTHPDKSEDKKEEEKENEDWEVYHGTCFSDSSEPFDRITVKRTLARCKLACVNEREFLCRSVEWDMRDHFCNLTRHNVDIKKPTKPCDPNWIVLYERVDPPVAFVPAKPGSFDEEMHKKWIAPKNKPVPKDMVQTWEMDVDELKAKLTKMKKDKEKKKKKKSKKKKGKKGKETDKTKEDPSDKNEENEDKGENYDADEVLKKLVPDGIVNTGFMKTKYKIKRHMQKDEL